MKMEIDWVQWKTAIMEFGKVGSPRIIDGYSMFLSDRYHISISIVPTVPSAVHVISPKTSFGYLLIEKNLVPDDISYLQTTMLSDTTFRHLLGAILKERNQSIVYINDMDPIGIAQWIALKHGIDECELILENVHYVGIDDAWIDLCECWSTDNSIRRIVISMKEEEISLFKRLENVLPLSALVGERSYGLMKDGWKIELEGAINPTLYRGGYLESLFNHLRGRYRSVPR